MKYLKGILPIFAFAVAIMISAFTSNANTALVTQGWEVGNCGSIQNIDGGFNCGSSGTITCKINGNDAYNSQSNCQTGDGSTGLLKRS